MNLKKAFVGLGGNIGDTSRILRQALKQLEGLEGVFDLKVSSFYLTTPVGPIPQDHYVNAACCFDTSYSAVELLVELQKIEIILGKVEKPKNAPRVIDLDLLFFDTEIHHSAKLQVPHPRWRERLFVLTPLSDLVDELDVPSSHGIERLNLNQVIQKFSNIHQETVSLLLDKMAI